MPRTKNWNSIRDITDILIIYPVHITLSNSSLSSPISWYLSKKSEIRMKLDSRLSKQGDPYVGLHSGP